MVLMYFSSSPPPPQLKTSLPHTMLRIQITGSAWNTLVLQTLSKTYSSLLMTAEGFFQERAIAVIHYTSTNSRNLILMGLPWQYPHICSWDATRAGNPRNWWHAEFDDCTCTQTNHAYQTVHHYGTTSFSLGR